MNPAPSPDPLEVVLRTGPAEWWQVVAAFGPLAVLFSAVLAAFISWNTLRQRRAADREALAQKRETDLNALSQKTEADSRAEWWRRTQWALEAALDHKPEKQDIGLAVLELLTTSNLAGPEEAQIIAEAWKQPLAGAEATLDRLRPLPDNEDTELTREGRT